MNRIRGSGGVKPWIVAAGASAWMAGAANLPLWRALHSLGLLARPSGWGLALAMFTLMACGLFAIISFFAWRWTFKPVIVILLVAAALGSYFMTAYGVVIDTTMIVNTVQTDVREATALWSPRLLATLAVLALLPAWLVWRTPVAHATLLRQALRNAGALVLALVLAVAAVLAAFQPFASAMRNHKQLRYLMNPLNSVWALGSVATEPLRMDKSVLVPVAQDARAATPAGRAPLLVLVVGETARAGNFSINGYGRPTTPQLAARDVLSFTNAWSCGTSTAASLPCMFTNLGRVGFDERKHNTENVIDVLQRAGLAVLWIDNQAGGCKGVCDRAPNVNVSASQHPTLCANGECLDRILLEGLEQRVAALPAERRAKGVVLVLHTMGSHGPAYWLRSPPGAKRFMPECTSVNLQDCPAEALINAYDNSIAYTDEVLAATIDWLKARQDQWNTAMLYVSDHGESLGENNLYLHGLPYALAPDVQKHVPWITWFSPGFVQARGLRPDCLRQRLGERISHDNLFDSVLGLVRVSTTAYRADRDIYAACAADAARTP